MEAVVSRCVHEPDLRLPINATSALPVLSVALFVFREAFSPTRALGILFSLAGLALMTRR